MTIEYTKNERNIHTFLFKVADNGEGWLLVGGTENMARIHTTAGPRKPCFSIDDAIKAHPGRVVVNTELGRDVWTHLVNCGFVLEEVV